MSIVVGIDPGQKGGLAVFENGEFPTALKGDPRLNVLAMPLTEAGFVDTFKIREWINSLSRFLMSHVRLAAIEKVHSMPKQGVVSVFSFGANYGALVGLIISMDIPFILVRPQEWKKEVLKGMDWKGKKKASIAYCQQRWPDVNLLPTERCRVPSDGIADAICIAEYGSRKL